MEDGSPELVSRVAFSTRLTGPEASVVGAQGPLRVKTSKAQNEQCFQVCPRRLSICAFLEAISSADASRDAGASSRRRVTTADDVGASAYELASPARDATASAPSSGVDPGACL
jgi:hypothetical protein